MTRYKQLPLVTLWDYNTILRALENEMRGRIRRHPEYEDDVVEEYTYLMTKLRRESKEIKVE
jgi:hypothetical protein